jgi:DNA repair protein RecO (recombination protein O)
MITETHNALLLNKRASGETSLHLTFFTYEQGIISAISKGGRSLKKQPLFQEFTPLSVSFNVSREWYYVNQIDFNAKSLFLTGKVLFAGLYINEILYHGIQFGDPYPDLYNFYLNALDSLSMLTDQENELIEATLRRFEWQFLSACGYEFSLTHEAFNEKPIVSENYYTFIEGTGFVLDNNGIKGSSIIAMSEDNLTDKYVLKAAKWIMRKAINHALLGKQIKTRQFYTALLGT